MLLSYCERPALLPEHTLRYKNYISNKNILQGFLTVSPAQKRRQLTVRKK